MNKRGFSRPLVIVLLAFGSLTLLSFFVLSGIYILSLPTSGSGPTLSGPVRWNGLPLPVVTRPEWTTYSYAGPIRDLANVDGLLWAATDGGLVVWDLTKTEAPAAKFLVEHGLAANRVTTVAAGRDGVIWAGTVGGLSRYDGRNWQTFTVADGLPDDYIRDLVVDREGFIWVATSAGLARFDGREWRVYSDRGLFPSLPDSRVSSLAVDPANRLWAGTEQGLARFDGRWTSFTPVDGFPTAGISRLAADDNGDLWFSSANGLVRFNGTDWETIRLPAPAAGDQAAAPLVFEPVGDGTVIVGLNPNQPELIRYDPTDGRGELLPLAAGETTRGVSSVVADGEGTVWIGLGDQVHRLHGDENAILSGPSELPSTTIRDMLPTGNGLWLATSGGVARFDGSTWQSYQLVDDPAGAEVSALAIDSDGSIWSAFASPLDGVAHFDSGQNQWETLACPVEAPAGIDINAAVMSPDGAIWFATESGVSRSDGRSWRGFTTRDGLPTGTVTDLAVDDSGAIWAGTARGLARYEGGRWLRIDDNPVVYLAAAPNSLWRFDGVKLTRIDDGLARREAVLPLATAVRGLAATPDAAWLATANGVLRFDDSGWTAYSTADGLPSLDVTAITTDGDSVWAASSGDSQEIDIVVFDGAAWRPHPNRDEAAEQLLDNIIRDIISTPDGAMWLATPAGANRFADGRWSSFVVENGLPGPDIRAFAWAYDTLWAATNLGLARFNGRSWEGFGATAHDQPAAGVRALAVAPTGEMWVALEEGWPNSLRVFDGQKWTVVPTLSDNTTVHQLAFTPSGDLIALVTDNGRQHIGFYNGRDWAWQSEDQWPLQIAGLAIDAEGRLWARGWDRTSTPAEPVIAILALSSQGIGPVLDQVVLPPGSDDSVEDIIAGGRSNSVLFGQNGRVYAGAGGAVHIFEVGPENVLKPLGVLDVPLPFNRHVFALEADSAGRLWIGTERGVAILEPQTNSPDPSGIRTFYAPVRTPSWWGSARVLNVRPDGAIAVGTSAGGIGIYTGRGFDGVLHPSQGPPAWARSFFPIDAVLNDASNQLWVGSEGGGAARFTGTLWEVLAPDPALVAPVRSITLSDGQAWLGTEGGLVTIAGLSDHDCRFEQVEAGMVVNGTLRDAAGDVWVATTGDGVMQILDAGLAIKRELGSAPVPAMTSAPNGELWFANGHQPWLTRYRPPLASVEESTWGRLPLNLELVSPESISALAVAPNLDMWIGSEKGLARFSGGTWSGLTTADGLADNQIQELTVSPDGAVWAATAGGLSRYAPNSSK